MIEASDTLVPGSNEAFVVAVTAVGKSADGGRIAYELAVAFALSGLKAVLLDGEPAARSALMATADRRGAWDMGRPVEESLIGLAGNAMLLPGAGRMVEPLDDEETNAVASASEWLETHFDHVVIHVPKGISHEALQLLKMAPYLLLVITPEPAALTDGFSLLRVLHSSGARPRIFVLTHEVSSREESAHLYQRFQKLVAGRLPVYMHHIGFIPLGGLEDPGKVPLIKRDRHSPTGRALGHLALELETIRLEGVPRGTLSEMWRRLQQGEEPQPQPLIDRRDAEEGEGFAQRWQQQIEEAWRRGELSRRDLERIVERLGTLQAEARLEMARANDLERLKRASLEAAALGREKARHKPHDL